MSEACQRLLTACHIRKVRERRLGWGDALDGGERRVDLEHPGNGLGVLGSEAVAAEAANAGGTKLSAAADKTFQT